MIFRLKKVVNGEESTFSFQKILELLGDPINDEIQLDGEAYRISSLVSFGEGGGTGQSTVWESRELSIQEDAQTTIPISSIDGSIDHELLVNGVNYKHGISMAYHITNNTLYWHGAFDLEPSDEVVLRVQKPI
jgi:hypothetical protein